MDIGKGDEVVGPTSTIEGELVYTAVARVHATRWTVALGVPATVRSSALRDSALAYGGGIILSLGIGGIAAWRVSRSVARPIARLRDAASALGRGEPVRGADADVIEVEAVSEALVAAAALRKQNEAERELLLDAEREARASAEKAQARAAAARQRRRAALALARGADDAGSDRLGDRAEHRRHLPHRPARQGRRAAAQAHPPRRPGARGGDARVRAQSRVDAGFARLVRVGRRDRQDLLRQPRAEPADSYADPDFRAFVRDFNLRAACVVPLVARGRTIGAMCALQAESGRLFSEADGALVGELAQRAALALDNVRLFGESRDALREAEVANRAKDEFLAMLGHELRNPLAPIVTSLEVMARRRGVGDRERQIIERQVAHLSRMVDDLLDVSRIASGKIDLRRERVDLRDVIARALELTEPALQGRRPPEIRAGDSPVWVSGDPMRLTQVVCNLLTNAAKFSAPDQRIVVELRRIDGHAQLAVEDEGSGIRPSCCRTSSIASSRASRHCNGRAAGSASVWRSPRTWSSCMAGGSPPRVPAPDRVRASR